MKIAVYLRVSTDTQDEGMQIYAINNWMKDKCGKSLKSPNVTVYKDHGISGDVEERPDYLRMVNDIQNNKISIVISYDLSRVWRKAWQWLKFRENCESINVNIYSVKDNKLTGRDNFWKSFVGSGVKEDEKLSINQRQRDGIDKKQEAIRNNKDVWNGRGPDKKPRKPRSDKGKSRGKYTNGNTPKTI